MSTAAQDTLTWQDQPLTIVEDFVHALFVGTGLVQPNPGPQSRWPPQ
jgi:hypothetical protein